MSFGFRAKKKPLVKITEIAMLRDFFSTDVGYEKNEDIYLLVLREVRSQISPEYKSHIYITYLITISFLCICKCYCGILLLYNFKKSHTVHVFSAEIHFFYLHN